MTPAAVARRGGGGGTRQGGRQATGCGAGGTRQGRGRVVVAIRDGPRDPCDAGMMCRHLCRWGGAMVSVYTTKCEPVLGAGASGKERVRAASERTG